MAESVGPYLSPRVLNACQSILDSAQTAAWLRRKGVSLRELKRDRQEVFEWMAGKVTGNAPLYLEFGVFRGESMRWWSQRLQQPDARLIGFDTFEGLPVDWTWQMSMTDFDVGGIAPSINDQRIRFVRGRFEESLTQFALPNSDQWILMVDCDVYSSTRTVLEWAAGQTRPGDLLYFDEFKFFHDERRAFAEWQEEFGIKWTSTCIARGLRAAAFELV